MATELDKGSGDGDAQSARVEAEVSATIKPTNQLSNKRPRNTRRRMVITVRNSIDNCALVSFPALGDNLVIGERSRAGPVTRQRALLARP
jgi:hypothetical protein